jgi:hypothetical protein
MTALSQEDAEGLAAEAQAIWEANAEAWHAHIGAGGGWQTTLMAPVIERLLAVQPGERALDIACGDGIFAWRRAARRWWHATSARA